MLKFALRNCNLVHSLVRFRRNHFTLNHCLLHYKITVRKQNSAILNRKCCSSIYHSIPKRHFRISEQRKLHPVLVVLLKTKGVKAFKGLSLIFGRIFRKYHDRLPTHIQEKISRYKVSFGIFSVFVAYIFYYSYVHYTVAPITGRKRWISFTEEQITILADKDDANLQSMYGHKFLPVDNTLYKKCHSLVENLVKHNSDIPFVRNTDWVLHVVNDPDICNAFVLPNGHIYLFTGMITLMNDWEELSIVLGHEMSHAILGHTQEQQSFLTFSQLLLVPLICFIWFLFDDFMAFLTYALQDYLYPIVFELGFNLPFSRLLEMEADEVGLMLASKACVDPRWSVLLWDKMAVREVSSEKNKSDDNEKAVMEYISTHPSHEKRALMLEERLPIAMEMRSKCNCPPISLKIDPLKKAHIMRKITENIKERSRQSNALQQLQQENEKMSDEEISKNKLASESKTKLIVELEKEFVKLATLLDEIPLQETKVYSSSNRFYSDIWSIVKNKFHKSVFDETSRPSNNLAVKSVQLRMHNYYDFNE